MLQEKKPSYKYDLLVEILDGIRRQAPRQLESIYRPSRNDGVRLGQARSRTFIHLYLAVKHGVLGFDERENLITDDPGDGGLDAYFIDQEKNKIFLIQSKFPRTQEAFENSRMREDDLARMELKLIATGKKRDSRGVLFNKKISKFQSELKRIKDIALYEYQVVILANSPKQSDKNLRKLIDGFEYKIFDSTNTYTELVFPFCSSTFFEAKEIILWLNLSKKEKPRLQQEIKTIHGTCKLMLLLVPTKEIGRVVNKYRNAILEYNPRNFLSLSANKVNKNIRASITELQTNDFAIFNNGITIMAESVSFTENVGRSNAGQLILSNPQIINGGQTAYTLSKLYEEGLTNNATANLFRGKEVVLKIITFSERNQPEAQKFIEKISDATNKQTRVSEADRKSNEPILKVLQKQLFSEYGYLLERKQGEYFDSIDEGIIDKKYVIDRFKFAKAYLAFKGSATEARGRGDEKLFKEDTFRKIFSNAKDYRQMLLAFLILKYLDIRGKKESKNIAKYGYAFKYGKLAVVSASKYIQRGIKENELHGVTSIEALAQKMTDVSLGRWVGFEKFVRKQPNNRDYFRKQVDFDNYYKGKTVNKDLIKYFK